MSNWLNAAEAALKSIKEKTNIPYDWERFEAESTQQLPDNFIVYFLVDEPPALIADNKELSTHPRIQVSFFYRQKSDFPRIKDQIKEFFVAQGFIRVGSGRIPYQKDTGHYGWRYDFNFYERR